MKRLFFAFAILFLTQPVMPSDLPAEELYSAGEYSKALKTINKLEKAGNLTAKNALLKFEIYKKTGKNKEAKDALYQALMLDKNCYEAYIELGIFALEDNNPDLAQNNFKKAVEIEPSIANSADFLCYYAKICVLSKDYNSALKNILKAIEISPDEDEFYIELGKIYLYKNDYLKAVNAFEYAVSSNSELNSACFNYIGLANYKRGNYKQALNYFKRAVEIKESLFFLNNLALCYKSLEDETNYRKITGKMAEIKPDKPEEFLELSRLLYNKKDFNGAKNILKNGLEKYPDNLLLKSEFNKLNKT